MKIQTRARIQICTHTHTHTHTHQTEANLFLWYVQANHAGQDLKTEEDNKWQSNLELNNFNRQNASRRSGKFRY